MIIVWTLIFALGIGVDALIFYMVYLFEPTAFWVFMAIGSAGLIWSAMILSLGVFTWGLKE